MMAHPKISSITPQFWYNMDETGLMEGIAVTTQEEHSLYTHRKQQTGYWTEVPGRITREAVT